MKYLKKQVIEVEVRLPTTIYAFAKKIGVDRAELRRVLSNKVVASEKLYKKITNELRKYL